MTGHHTKYINCKNGKRKNMEKSSDKSATAFFSPRMEVGSKPTKWCQIILQLCKSMCHKTSVAWSSFLRPWPLAFCVSTEADFNSSSTTSRWPFPAAESRGVLPQPSREAKETQCKNHQKNMWINKRTFCT